MKDHITLSVPKGSQIISPEGTKVVKEVPENALELIEGGATWLLLKQSAREPLKKLSKEKLIKLIDMRKSQKITHDVAILEQALAEKEAGKNKPDDNKELPVK
ncbi:hypothetical protein [Chryseobacterium terrae]|uniref:Bacteriocin-protection, YdeI or OmpD-Associated n=1 Tax=Chryseobacterium terrae TaxID=3163299 RepID=A0ABW8Y4A7_9FLAO